jgi:hypothetical protein
VYLYVGDCGLLPSDSTLGLKKKTITYHIIFIARPAFVTVKVSERLFYDKSMRHYIFLHIDCIVLVTCIQLICMHIYHTFDHYQSIGSVSKSHNFKSYLLHARQYRMYVILCPSSRTNIRNNLFIVRMKVEKDGSTAEELEYVNW